MCYFRSSNSMTKYLLPRRFSYPSPFTLRSSVYSLASWGLASNRNVLFFRPLKSMTKNYLPRRFSYPFQGNLRESSSVAASVKKNVSNCISSFHHHSLPGFELTATAKAAVTNGRRATNKRLSCIANVWGYTELWDQLLLIQAPFNRWLFLRTKCRRQRPC